MRTFLVVAVFFCGLFALLMNLPDQQTTQASAPIVQGPDYNKPAKSKPAAIVQQVTREPKHETEPTVIRTKTYCQMGWQGFVCQSTNEEDFKVRLFYAIALECENGARPFVGVVQDVAAHGLQTRVVPYWLVGDARRPNAGYVGLSTCDQVKTMQLTGGTAARESSDSVWTEPIQ